MNTKKMKKRKDPLEQLIKAASPEVLGKLIKKLALSMPETRRECFEFLKKHVILTPEESAISEGEALSALWDELEFDLSELDEYGGGDYSIENHVGLLLYDLSEKLRKKKVPQKYRRELLDRVLPYIESGNAGIDDARLFVMIGGESENAMEVARGKGIFVVDGSRCRLALLHDRADRRGVGTDPNPPLIDTLHRSMLLWKQEKRGDLISHLSERGLLEDGPFWKLAQALFEVLPRDTEDWKLTNALLSERETLRMEGKRLEIKKDTLFNPIEAQY